MLVRLNYTSRLDNLLDTHARLTDDLRTATRKSLQKGASTADREEAHQELQSLGVRLMRIQKEALTLAAQADIDITGRLELFQGGPA